MKNKDIFQLNSNLYTEKRGHQIMPQLVMENLYDIFLKLQNSKVINKGGNICEAKCESIYSCQWHRNGHS